MLALSASLNGQKIKVSEMLPLFRYVREFYIKALGKTLNDDSLIKEEGVAEGEQLYVFERGTLRGSLKLQTILYLKDAGTPKESEKYFAQQTGTILGVLEQEEFFVDGNGSVVRLISLAYFGKDIYQRRSASTT